LTSHNIFSEFDGKSPSVSLPELSDRLLQAQAASWPQLAKGIASLETVRVRDVPCNGFSVALQFNPGRIVSTGARVDEKTIRERPCFLCAQNLPPEQRGILTYGEFLVLCNPAPIFRGHFTISHVNHLPQALEPFTHTFLRIAKDLGPAFSVFYNGPKCGASAPDHMHFQASPVGAIPVELDAADERRRKVLGRAKNLTILTLERYGRGVIILESAHHEDLAATLLNLIGDLRTLFAVKEEPMFNVLCSFQNHAWRVILFPRTKHRPDVFFQEGEQQVMVSPAAVDIGGLIITPREKDFDGLNAGMIEAMFQEVSVDARMIQEIVGNL
jgi:hypothetical protein